MITEVLVTTLLIVIAMLAVIPMLAIGVKSGNVSKGRSVEMHIAQERVEAYNTEKFTDIENFLKGEITDFEAFKTSGSAHELAPETIFVNPANGKKISSDNILDKPALLKNGFKEIIIRTQFSYLRGNDTNPLDDSIQVSVNIASVAENKSDSNTVNMTAIVSRDKF